MKLNIDITEYKNNYNFKSFFTQKKGFTIVEVSILFVIFLIVAFLVAPLSLDDSLQTKNASRWKQVQSDFINISYAINLQKEDENFDFNSTFNSVIKNEIKTGGENYKITFLNGTFPSSTYRFTNFFTTHSNATLSYKLYDSPQNGIYGLFMYDVNGQTGPNVWGKDVYGMNIYSDRFEPFCKNDSLATQRQDCSKNGTGLCCSNYVLNGGGIN